MRSKMGMDGVNDINVKYNKNLHKLLIITRARNSFKTSTTWQLPNIKYIWHSLAFKEGYKSSVYLTKNWISMTDKEL